MKPLPVGWPPMKNDMWGVFVRESDSVASTEWKESSNIQMHLHSLKGSYIIKIISLPPLLSTKIKTGLLIQEQSGTDSK